MALKDAIVLNKIIIIYSEITNDVYIDSDRRAHLFFSLKEAERFKGSTENIRLGDQLYVSKTDLMTEFYEAGAVSYVLHGELGRTEIADITKGDLKRQYYNAPLSASLNLLKQYKKRTYLHELRDKEFLVPVRIKKNDKTGKLQIAYGIIKNKESFYYLCFTDLKEYEKWSKYADGWAPLKVDFETIFQIGKRHGYIINVSTDRYPLTAGFLQEIKEGDKNA